MNRERFVQSLTVLTRAFRQEADELLFDAYGIGLEELTDDEVEYATKMAIKTCEFMPSPVQLATMVGKEPDAALMRPSSKCRACQITLELPESSARGYCGACWRGVISRRDGKQIETGSLRKMIGGA